MTMSVPRKLLSKDEVVVRHLRTHPKVLIWSIVGELLFLAAAIALTVLVPDQWTPAAFYVIWVPFVIASVPLFVLPWLRWRTTTYTITSKRVITRQGIINKRGHDLPMSRISDVQHEATVTDRMFGSGTLVLQTSSDDPLVLTDIPRVNSVQQEIANILFDDVQGAIDVDPTDTPTLD